MLVPPKIQSTVWPRGATRLDVANNNDSGNHLHIQPTPGIGLRPSVGVRIPVFPTYRQSSSFLLRTCAQSMRWDRAPANGRCMYVLIAGPHRKSRLLVCISLSRWKGQMEALLLRFQHLFNKAKTASQCRDQRVENSKARNGLSISLSRTETEILHHGGDRPSCNCLLDRETVGHGRTLLSSHANLLIHPVDFI